MAWRRARHREGRLLSYGVNVPDLFRRTAELANRILRGANPAEIPVEQPNVYDFVVNLRTARALGVVFPRSVLLQATRVIE
jgi:putative ABC transport system substrate-binding protein